mgnify:FL=1
MSTKTSIEFSLKGKFLELLNNKIDFLNGSPGETGLLINFTVT